MPPKYPPASVYIKICTLLFAFVYSQLINNYNNAAYIDTKPFPSLLNRRYDHWPATWIIIFVPHYSFIIVFTLARGFVSPDNLAACFRTGCTFFIAADVAMITQVKWKMRRDETILVWACMMNVVSIHLVLRTSVFNRRRGLSGAMAGMHSPTPTDKTTKQQIGTLNIAGKDICWPGGERPAPNPWHKLESRSNFDSCSCLLELFTPQCNVLQIQNNRSKHYSTEDTSQKCLLSDLA